VPPSARGEQRRGDPQARAGSRLAQVHRRVHDGEVQEDHRTRRRARAPVPAGSGART
jgi:hypothetical protein